MLDIINYHDNAQLNLINHTTQVYLKTCGAIYYHVLFCLLKLYFKEHLVCQSKYTHLTNVLRLKGINTHFML